MQTLTVLIAVLWNGKVVSLKRRRQIWWLANPRLSPSRYDYKLVGVKTPYLQYLKYFIISFSVDDILHHRDNTMRNCIFIRDNL